MDKKAGKFKDILNSIKKIFIKYRYFFERVIIAICTLFLCSIVTFFLMRMMPGDVVDNYTYNLMAQKQLPYDSARRLAVQLLNYDPDENIFVQLGRFYSGLFRGNLGQSIYVEGLTTNDIIKKSLPWTLFISSCGLFLSYVIGTAIGARMAYKRKGVENAMYSTYIVVSSTIPDYLFGLIILYIFGYTLGFFPTFGAYDIEVTVGLNFRFLLSCLHHAFLPICAYVFTGIGGWALSMKGSCTGVLGEDYVNAGIARGLPEKIIVKKYLKKNAKLPLITSLALSFAGLFGGSSVMESIFAYPGIGYAFSSYVASRDYFIMQGLFFFMSVVIIIANLIADSIYTIVDPRIRRGS
ncbi:MAG: ABC transporter permease [Acholeplasmataceae bacterium]|jgi:peptide/nickel transport system permease protein